MKRKILSLRPTQFAVGMLEIDEKIKEVEKFSKKELKDYINDNAVPVVRSPDDELYVVDKHHFLCVCHHLGVEKVKVEIIKDFQLEVKMDYEKFWKWMFKSRNSYPYCQFGEGPREPIYLPHDIRGLADDPYRSIAWFVRKAGAFENSDKNFAEFTWANFFRSKKLLSKFGRKGFPQALIVAVKLAQSEEARGLPGFDKLNKSETLEVQSVAKKKGVEALKNKKQREQG
jgi:hypothetical protein